jgi:DNA repair and recombination protein RAD54B
MSGLQASGSSEKVVVVSNFTSTLDQVESLAGLRVWGETLRIDGQVPVDKRQSLVDAFNRPSDKRRLFLLSSKAGGVGLNL